MPQHHTPPTETDAKPLDSGPASEGLSGLDALFHSDQGIAPAMVRTLREPLLVLDGDFRVQAANPAFYRTFRVGRDETLGVPLFELGNGQWDIPALRDLVQDILPRDRMVEDFEVVHSFEEIGPRSMLLNARRLEREEPGRELILMAIEDVTERRRAERDLKRSNEELERFAYVASHDLQEPLRMVASYTQLLARRYEGELDERADKYIRYAVEGAERMKELIRGLLEYSRVGTQGNPPEPTDADEVLDRTLEDVRIAILESDADLTRDPLPRVLVDPVQLRQVFQNLIENSIKFCGNGPPVIHISGRREGDLCVFSVRDEGEGIDPEYLERVFVIFQRLHGAESPGTGIGLALCKKVVERHGGRMWIESEPGEGATFYFTLPAA